MTFCECVDQGSKESHAIHLFSALPTVVNIAESTDALITHDSSGVRLSRLAK